MDMRAEVWSPLQNTACWLGAWLWGYENTDETVTALTQLWGELRDFEDGPFINFLQALRRHVGDLLESTDIEPVLTLALGGAGQAPLIPADVASTLGVSEAIIVRSPHPEDHLLLTPTRTIVNGQDFTRFNLTPMSSPAPSPLGLTPGEANHLLDEALEKAAQLVEALDYRSEPSQRLTDPRLTVGSLADFFDTPGLPQSVPDRSAQLFARADTAAAIIETITDRAGDHSLDHVLLGINRNIRHARIAGVAYALSEFAR